MIVAILKESDPAEKRVALTPPHVQKLKDMGFQVIVESQAGAGSFLTDEAYQEKGAEIMTDRQQILAKAKILVRVLGPKDEEIEQLKEGQIWISTLDPFFNLNLIRKLAEKKVTSFALEFIPRITRAQSMDVLSSMSSIIGYKAVIAAAMELPKYFPMLMTAAGTISPAKVFVLGAGVAGLQAIATAKRLGAIVEAYDVRPVVKEQVESLGAKFVEFDLKTTGEDKGGYAKEQSAETLQKQQELMAEKLKEMDVVITTALIPGKKAPILITDKMLQGMQAGSVIVDIATEKGGNVEGSAEGQIVEKDGVKIIGFSDYPSRTSKHASRLYSNNVCTFLVNMTEAGNLKVDLDDEIVAGTLITKDGQVMHEKIKEAFNKGA